MLGQAVRDQMNLMGITKKVNELAIKARNSQLGPAPINKKNIQSDGNVLRDKELGNAFGIKNRRAQPLKNSKLKLSKPPPQNPYKVPTKS